MSGCAYILVHMVEPQQPGFTFRGFVDPWPLHITLVPRFTVPEGEAALINELRTAARQVASFDVQVGPETLFGPKADIPVNVLNDQVVTRCLHLVLMDAVESQQAVFSDSFPYVRGTYHGHITRQTKDGKTYGMNPNDIHRVDSITLVRFTQDNESELCEVVTTLPLGEAI